MARALGLEGSPALTPYLTQNNLVGLASVLQNLGGFLGIQAFLWVTQRSSRRLAFGVSFILALVSTAFTFLFVGRLDGVWDVFWMIPIMGFCQLTLFGGYAIYFPELFPTRLRSTGTSFCYNVGRLVAALGPFTLGVLDRVGVQGLPGPTAATPAAWQCARCSWWACSPCRSPRKRRVGHCRSERNNE